MASALYQNYHKQWVACCEMIRTGAANGISLGQFGSVRAVLAALGVPGQAEGEIIEIAKKF